MHQTISLKKWQISGIAVVVVLSVVLGAVVASAVTLNRAGAHGGDASLVHACVNQVNAEVRIAHPGPGNASTDCTALGPD